MSRILILALTFSLGHSSVALAAGALLASATRITRQAAEAPLPPLGNAAAAKRTRADSGLPLAQAPPSLASSGMKKRTKLLIGLMVAAAFVGGVYAIDQGVEDNTPSSSGLR